MKLIKIISRATLRNTKFQLDADNSNPSVLTGFLLRSAIKHMIEKIRL